LHPELSFDQAPPISVPYRFFLTAPWFGVAAGLLLLIYGKSVLVTRWAPETLAVTHLITAGFMLQAMCGALLQFIPVTVGGNVANPIRLASFVHPIFIAGALVLAGGFLSGESVLLLAAPPLFVLGGTAFVIALFAALRRITVANPTLTALKLSLLALALTIVFGSVLSLSLGLSWSLQLLELTAVHVGLGLAGWGLVLLLGVSLYVVPMFQLTPPYPVWFARQMPRWVVALILVSLLSIVVPGNWLITSVTLGFFAVAAAYAVMTIRLQMRRRRRLTDPSFWFFRGGMVAVLTAVALGGLRLSGVFIDLDAPLLLSTGVLLLGAFMSVISGMLYKVVPFINWLHLQRLTQELAGFGSMPPNMRLMIPEAHAQRQMLMHFVALLMILLAVWWPALVQLAGLMLMVSSAWLGINLLGGVRRYVVFSKQIRADASAQES
jgi:hypothetical protein